MDMNRLLHNAKGHAYRALSRFGDQTWYVRSTRIFEGIRHFKEAGNTAQAENLLNS